MDMENKLACSHIDSVLNCLINIPSYQSVTLYFPRQSKTILLSHRTCIANLPISTAFPTCVKYKFLWPGSNCIIFDLWFHRTLPAHLFFQFSSFGIGSLWGNFCRKYVYVKRCVFIFNFLSSWRKLISFLVILVFSYKFSFQHFFITHDDRDKSEFRFSCIVFLALWKFYTLFAS